MTRKQLDARVSAGADERTAAKYERQADRSKAIAYRHTRLAVEAASRGDYERSRFEMAQSRLAWEATHLDRHRANSLRNRSPGPDLAFDTSTQSPHRDTRRHEKGSKTTAGSPAAENEPLEMMG